MSSIYQSVSENLALYTVRAKYVPDFENGGFRLANVCSFSRPVFNPGHLEESRSDVSDFSEKQEENPGSSSPDNFQRSARRARQKCFDICLCNSFDAFVTLTFNKEYVNRTSYSDCYGKLRVWLSNRVSRKNMYYVCCPEYHKDGEAIHFHLLCNSSALSLVDSTHRRKGKVVYNLADWKWGFSTAILIDGEKAFDRISKYIMKYMTKNQGQKVGGRFYLSGGELFYPKYAYSDNPGDFCDIDNCVYHRVYERDFGTYEEWSFV